MKRLSRSNKCKEKTSVSPRSASHKPHLQKSTGDNCVWCGIARYQIYRKVSASFQSYSIVVWCASLVIGNFGGCANNRIMSTAIMSQNAMYEFGDNLIKNGVYSDSMSGAQLAVGSTVRLTLSRMASSPVGATTQNLTMLLGNLTQQHRRLERTQSAPAPGMVSPQAALTATTVNTSRYKTELCRPFEEFGVCKYGDKCQFAHGLAELRSLARHPKYKTELCRTYHTVGFCPYGPRCHFVHNQDEAVPKSPTPTVAAMAAQRSRPVALSPSLSLDSPSPPCSLSQSPTSSMGSFFSSDPELHSPGPLDDQRLPVFNRLSTTQLLTLKDLML